MKLNNRTTWLVVGSLGVIGVGGSAALGVGPFSVDGDSGPEWDSVQLDGTPAVTDVGETVTPSASPTATLDGSATTTVTPVSARTVVSAQTTLSAQTPVSTKSPVSPRT